MNPAPPARPPLDRVRLAAAVPGLVVSEESPSTNLEAAEQARAGAAHGQVFVTEHQTAGRGRLGRSWQTPPRAALTFSVLVRPAVPATQWPWLPLLTGLAVVDALAAHEVPVGLKWPNDVLVGDRKLAGILLERLDTPAGPVAVVGVGLNVSATQAELPVSTATSLALEGVSVDRTDLLLALLAAFWRRYDHWQQAGSAEVREAYTRACRTLGQLVRVDLPAGGQLAGLATGIDHDGRLQVQTTHGTQAVGAGDVVHVR